MKLSSLIVLVISLTLSACGRDSNVSREKSHITSPEAAKLLLLSQQAVNRDDYLTALSYTDSALVLDPANPKIHFLRGIIHDELHRTNDAKVSFLKAYQIDQDIQGIKFYLANIYFKYQEFDSARVLYEKAIEDYQQEEALFPKVKAHANLGVTYSRLGLSDSAFHQFQNAINLNPDYAETYYLMAKEFRDQGESAKALKYINQAISLNNGNPDYLFEAGNLEYQLGNYISALKHFDKVLAHSSWNYRATYLHGQCLLRIGKTEEAEQQLAHADSLKKQLAQIVVLEDNARQKKNDMMAWSNLGKAYLELGDYQRSEDALLMAISLSPDNIVLLNNLAHLNMLQEQPNEAIAYFQHILNIDPHLADVWTTLGIVYAQLGEYSNAEFAWRAALRERPDHPVAKSYLEQLAQSG